MTQNSLTCRWKLLRKFGCAFSVWKFTSSNFHSSIVKTRMFPKLLELNRIYFKITQKSEFWHRFHLRIVTFWHVIRFIYVPFIVSIVNYIILYAYIRKFDIIISYIRHITPQTRFRETTFWISLRVQDPWRSR